MAVEDLVPDQYSSVDRSRLFWEARGFPNPEHEMLMCSILLCHNTVVRKMEEVLKTFGLGMSRYSALIALVLSKTGAIRLSNLGRILAVHQTAVTKVVDQLVRDGFVVREQHATDRRVTLAVINPAGRALARQAAEAVAQVNFGLPEMPPDQSALIVDLLRPVWLQDEEQWD
jgi:DNA-binding MarR family transcriptional regulator